MILVGEFKDIEFIGKTNVVLARGREIGRVTDIYKEGSSIFVEMDIESGSKIPSDAKAMITELSYLGGRTVSLIYEESCDGNCLEDGAIIPGYVSTLKEVVAAVAQPILDSISIKIDTLLGPSGINNMLQQATNSIEQLNKTVKGLNKQLSIGFKGLPEQIKSMDQSMEGMLTIADNNNTQLVSDLKTYQQLLAAFAENPGLETLSGMNKKVIDFNQKIDQFKPKLSLVDSTIDQLQLQLTSIEWADSNMATLLMDADFRDSTQLMLDELSTNINEIRLHPENNLSLVKKK